MARRAGFARGTIANTTQFASIAGLKGEAAHQSVWARGLIFAALYFVAMIAGIMLTRFGAQVAPVWAPSAILAWALLSSERHHWLILLGMTAAAHVAGAFVVGDQTAIELVYLVANLASPLLLAALMRWRGDTFSFADRGEVVRFLLVGGVLAPGVSTAIVALSASAGLIDFSLRTAAIWFLADGLSFLVFLPLFHVLATNGWRTLFEPGVRRRTFTLLAIMIAAHLIAMVMPAMGYRIFMVVLIPFLVYIAFDVGQTAARAAVAISALLVLAYALFAPAPADRSMHEQEFLLVLQVYVAAMIASVLPIAAALAERQRLHETAAQALQDAQDAWGELIAAEAHYRHMAESTEDLILRLNSAGDIRFASPSSIALRQGDDGLAGANLIDLAHADDAAKLREGIAALIAANDRGQPRLWQVRLRGMNDDWILCDVHATLVAPGEFIAVVRAAAP